MRWQFVLGLQPLFLLDDLVLQPRIFISKPMLLAIYSDQLRPSPIPFQFGNLQNHSTSVLNAMNAPLSTSLFPNNSMLLPSLQSKYRGVLALNSAAYTLVKM